MTAPAVASARPQLLLEPRTVVLRHAQSFAGWCAEEPRDSNRGQAVEHFLATVGLPPGQPWCAAFVYACGVAMLGPNWPCPKTGGCAVLGEWAAKECVLADAPMRGDLFLLFEPKLQRFGHTGFVSGLLADGSCQTVEGNTNDGGSRDGWGVFQRTRRFGPHDRFIRWHTLIH